MSETTPASTQVATIFKATLPSINYIFKNGKPAIFVFGKFITAIKAEVDELKAEIEAGHPHIFIDFAEAEIDASAIDVMANLRESIIAEYVAKMALANNPENNMGNTTEDPLKPASSQDIAPAASGGAGTAASAARLVNLAKSVGK